MLRILPLSRNSILDRAIEIWGNLSSSLSILAGSASVAAMRVLSQLAVPMILACGMASSGQELPLPIPLEPPTTSPPIFLKPTISIKPPQASPAGTAAPRSTEQLLSAEQKVINDRLAQIADQRDRETKATAALKRLVLLQGPAGKKNDPRVVLQALGNQKPVTLIGVSAPVDTLRRLEGFFGAALTPDNEKKILDAVRSGFAGAANHERKVEVFGWWPNEGVMAVAVWPES